MNATTKTTLDLAKTLAKSGFHIPAIEIHTPDGRTWNIATVVPIDEFMVDSGNGKMVPITTLPLRAAKHTTMAQDPDKAEHLVRVEWIKTVPQKDAVKEKGFFGNQNSAAKPRAKNWAFTVERLKQRFGIESGT